MRTILAFLLLTSHACAAECAIMSLEQFKAAVDQQPGWTWVGVEPAPHTSDGYVVYYYEFEGKTYMSPVVDGCVANKAYLMGHFLPEQKV